MKAVNKMGERFVKEFGKKKFLVSFVVEEQDEILARALVEHLFSTYKTICKGAEISSKPEISVMEVI